MKIELSTRAKIIEASPATFEAIREALSFQNPARIIDFADVRVPVLRAGAISRLRAYRRMAGVELENG